MWARYIMSMTGNWCMTRTQAGYVYDEDGLEYDNGTWEWTNDDDSNWIYNDDGSGCDGSIQGWVCNKKWGPECGKASWEWYNEDHGEFNGSLCGCWNNIELNISECWPDDDLGGSAITISSWRRYQESRSSRVLGSTGYSTVQLIWLVSDCKHGLRSPQGHVICCYKYQASLRVIWMTYSRICQSHTMLTTVGHAGLLWREWVSGQRVEGLLSISGINRVHGGSACEPLRGSPGLCTVWGSEQHMPDQKWHHST